MKVHNNETNLPKVKRIDDLHAHGIASQLSTITEKESEENLLHNYLKKGHKKKRSKSNINKVKIIKFRIFTTTLPRLTTWSLRSFDRRLESPLTIRITKITTIGKTSTTSWKK